MPNVTANGIQIEYDTFGLPARHGSSKRGCHRTWLSKNINRIH